MVEKLVHTFRPVFLVGAPAQAVGLPVVVEEPRGFFEAAQREVDAALSDDTDLGDAVGLESEARDAGARVRRTRAEREAEAEERLADLKRRMGK